MTTKTAFITVIDDGATLADGARAAGDLDTANANAGVFADAYLNVNFTAGPPDAGNVVAELYMLPGDGESSETFPQGGDAGLGTDVDPQKSLLTGVFETRSPSVSVDEILSVRNIQLGIGTNRFVLKNVSSHTMNATWQLDVVCWTP